MAEATFAEVVLVGLVFLIGVLIGVTFSLRQVLLPPPPRRNPRRPHRAPSWCLFCCTRASARPADCAPCPRPAGTGDFCPKREEQDNQIGQEEDETTKLQNNICNLAKKLAHVNETLASKMASQNELEPTTAETVAAS